MYWIYMPLIGYGTLSTDLLSMIYHHDSIEVKHLLRLWKIGKVISQPGQAQDI